MFSWSLVLVVVVVVVVVCRSSCKVFQLFGGVRGEEEGGGECIPAQCSHAVKCVCCTRGRSLPTPACLVCPRSRRKGVSPLSFIRERFRYIVYITATPLAVSRRACRFGLFPRVCLSRLPAGASSPCPCPPPPPRRRGASSPRTSAPRSGTGARKLPAW